MVAPLKPWVAVVVLGYKQAAYLPACLASLDAQGLAGVQVILVDNGSADGSAEIMQAWANHHPETNLLLLPQNLGHCKAFNKALAWVQAPYVTDLAADDALLPGSLLARVQALAALPEAAFCHANAVYVDKKGQHMHLAHPSHAHPPQGFVWQRLFEGRFICPPTVLFNTEALRAVGGYDEALSFEDFDCWMRLARHHPVVYCPHVSVAYRQHAGAASRAQIEGRRDGRTQRYLDSVALILAKAHALSQTPAERRALARFAAYHVRLAAYVGLPKEAKQLTTWMHQHKLPIAAPHLWPWLARLPLHALYAFYVRIRY